MMSNAQAMALIRAIDQLCAYVEEELRHTPDPSSSDDMEQLGNTLVRNAKRLRKLEDKLEKHDRAVRKMVGRG